MHIIHFHVQPGCAVWNIVAGLPIIPCIIIRIVIRIVVRNNFIACIVIVPDAATANEAELRPARICPAARHSSGRPVRRRSCIRLAGRDFCAPKGRNQAAPRPGQGEGQFLFMK